MREGVSGCYQGRYVDNFVSLLNSNEIRLNVDARDDDVVADDDGNGVAASVVALVVCDWWC